LAIVAVMCLARLVIGDDFFEPPRWHH
jgi:hypothetical protein